MTIQEGKAAPAFTLPDANGNKVTLKDFRGEHVIRSTVWIGPDGKLKKQWPKVARAADHPLKVLEALKEMS